MKATSFLKRIAAAAAISLLGVTCTVAAQPTAQHPWAAMTQADADFITDWLKRESITAIYPAPDAFAAQLAAARRVLDAESSQVTSYQGYRHALNRYVGSLQDLHLYLQHSLAPSTYQWPGFLGVYRGGRYLALPKAGALSGQEITQCDGKPMGEWVHQVATYEQLILGVEATKARAAPLVFRDGGSPFIPRPRSCRIGGQDVTLEWQPIAASKLSADIVAATIFRDRLTTISPFGADGAWVRMGIFHMQTQEEGKVFKQLITDAPALRDKSVIVLDVRGNGGGSYDWFMGFLRALYGKDYADYHARARLQIANVLRTTPAILEFYNSDRATEVGDLVPPADGTPFDPDNKQYEQALAAGKTLFVTPANARAIPMPSAVPRNPVKARVFVLTDYNCASACISFVDELKRFPGVEQIGVETGIDSRTGTAIAAPLPSGNGVIHVPTMTRDGRERGDNIPHRPDRVFTGNIADTAAVKAWVEDEIVGPKAGERGGR